MCLWSSNMRKSGLWWFQLTMKRSSRVKISLPYKLMFSLWPHPNNLKPLRVCAAAIDLSCFHLKSQRRKTQTLKSLTHDSSSWEAEGQHQSSRISPNLRQTLRIIVFCWTRPSPTDNRVATTTAEKVESWESTFQQLDSSLTKAPQNLHRVSQMREILHCESKKSGPLPFCMFILQHIKVPFVPLQKAHWWIIFWISFFFQEHECITNVGAGRRWRLTLPVDLRPQLRGWHCGWNSETERQRSISLRRAKSP